MHQLDLAVCDEGILQELWGRALGVNELTNKLKANKKTVIRHLKIMEGHGFVTHTKVKKKKVYELTEKGREACAILRIKREAGYIGLEWAEAKKQQGFKVRFLADMTGLPQHKRWLFAWNPQTGECDLAAIFGVRSLASKGGPPRYLAQLVDWSKSPDKPLKSAELFEFLQQNVQDWTREENIQKALKKFWSLENFNAYFCAFVPEEISFGFPAEIGHFSSLIFVGFGYQQDFPFILETPLMGGGFNLSENLKVLLEYRVNLMMMRNYSWLVAKKVIDPNSVLDKELKLAKNSMFNFHVNLACKNGQNGKCKKMGIKCVAITEQRLDFSKCPILVEEVKQAEIKYPEKTQT